MTKVRLGSKEDSSWILQRNRALSNLITDIKGTQDHLEHLCCTLHILHLDTLNIDCSIYDDIQGEASGHLPSNFDLHSDKTTAWCSFQQHVQKTHCALAAAARVQHSPPQHFTCGNEILLVIAQFAKDPCDHPLLPLLHITNVSMLHLGMLK